MRGAEHTQEAPEVNAGRGGVWLNRQVDEGSRRTPSLNPMVELPSDRLDAVFHALADPTRRAMLHALASGGAPFLFSYRGGRPAPRPLH